MTSAWPLLESSSPTLGWETRRVGDLVELTNGFPFDSDLFGPDGRLPLVRIRDLFSDEFATFVSGFVPDQVVLRDGDIVIGMDGDFELTVWRRGPAALNQRMCLLRPRGGVDARFVAYALPRHLRVLNDLTYATTVKHLSSFDILAERMRCPPLAQQRAIADYLDAETARIDVTVERLTQANLLLDEWLAAEIEDTIWSAGDPLASLMHLTPGDRQIQYGIVLPGPDVPDGVPIVKGGDIVTGHLGAVGLARTTYEIEAGYERSRLRLNDVVFAIRGAVGACAPVPDEVEGANITQDVARVSPLPGVDPAWLLYALRSRSLQQQVEARIVGATIRGINIRDLKRVRVPVPTSAAQGQRAEVLASAQAHRDQVSARRKRQVNLLLERRQALITAAVTGQLAIPGVAA